MKKQLRDFAELCRKWPADQKRNQYILLRTFEYVPPRDQPRIPYKITIRGLLKRVYVIADTVDRHRVDSVRLSDIDPDTLEPLKSLADRIYVDTRAAYFEEEKKNAEMSDYESDFEAIDCEVSSSTHSFSSTAESVPIAPPLPTVTESKIGDDSEKNTNLHEYVFSKGKIPKFNKYVSSFGVSEDLAMSLLERCAAGSNATFSAETGIVYDAWGHVIPWADLTADIIVEYLFEYAINSENCFRRRCYQDHLSEPSYNVMFEGGVPFTLRYIKSSRTQMIEPHFFYPYEEECNERSLKIDLDERRVVIASTRPGLFVFEKSYPITSLDDLCELVLGFTTMSMAHRRSLEQLSNGIEFGVVKIEPLLLGFNIRYYDDSASYRLYHVVEDRIYFGSAAMGGTSIVVIKDVDESCREFFYSIDSFVNQFLKRLGPKGAHPNSIDIKFASSEATLIDAKFASSEATLIDAKFASSEATLIDAKFASSEGPRHGKQTTRETITSLDDLQNSIYTSLLLNSEHVGNEDFKATVTEPYSFSDEDDYECNQLVMFYDSAKEYDWSLFALVYREILSEMIRPNQKRVLWALSSSDLKELHRMYRVPLCNGSTVEWIESELSDFLEQMFGLVRVVDDTSFIFPTDDDGCEAKQFQFQFEFTNGTEQMHAALTKLLGSDRYDGRDPPLFCEFLRYGGDVKYTAAWVDQLSWLGADCFRKGDMLCRKKRNSLWNLLRNRFKDNVHCVKLNPQLIELDERGVEFAERGYQLVRISESVAWVYNTM